MSDDIVERLFNWQDDTGVMEIRQTAEDIQKLMAEGADEIERLQARLAEAEALLREARGDVQYHHDCAEIEDCIGEQGEAIERLARIDAFLSGPGT